MLVRGSCRKHPTSHTSASTNASRAFVEAKKAFDEDLGGLATHSSCASLLGSIGACLSHHQQLKNQSGQPDDADDEGDQDCWTYKVDFSCSSVVKETSLERAGFLKGYRNP